MTDQRLLETLAGSLTASTLAAVLADLNDERQPTGDVQRLATRVFGEQLVCLVGEDAAERLRPEFRQSPAGPTKVQHL
jgi:hypothetical protein